MLTGLVGPLCVEGGQGGQLSDAIPFKVGDTIEYGGRRGGGIGPETIQLVAQQVPGQAGGGHQNLGPEIRGL